MSDKQRQKILSSVEAGDFIGRTRELDALLQHARMENAALGMLFASAPLAGASEILKQIFDQLFYEQGEITPFYFAIGKNDKNARRCAVRFLQTFIKQVVASRRQNPQLLNFGGDMCELAELAVPSDGYWIDRLIENCRSESCLNDDLSFIRTALSAPLRAAAAGLKIFVMIDDLHDAQTFSGEADFINELKEVYERSELPFVFAGRRRFLSEKIQANYHTLTLETLSFADAGRLTENLSAKYGVKINEQTRDLIAAQLDGKPAFIEFLFHSAQTRKHDLESFQAVEKFYTDEIFAGRIKRFYDAQIEEIIPDIETQKHFLGLLYDALTIEKGKTPVESWQFRTNLDNRDFYGVMNRLNTHEIIRLTSNLAEAMSENDILSDYLKSRFRLEMLAEPRALVIAEALSGSLKRAPQMMARLYRRKTAIGLREILSVFDSQEIPAALLDYGAFKNELKGAPDAEILKELENSRDKIKLPQVVYAAHTVAFYAPIEQLAERERSAVAFGFDKRAYTDADETVWIAAEIDSKLEAAKDLTEFWCDRLEVAALMCDFRNYKIWLIAPEGFSPEALEVLKARGSFGSSLKQINLLIKTLDIEALSGRELRPNEYEIIVPMGDDTELIAAQTVEEIARRHHFAPKAINQIKTALVEACINAAEHSHSPDRKIYQKFAVEDDKLTVIVANRGLRLADKKAQEITPTEGRRGWGLKLMKSLMDDVKFEETDDGTRISMTKYLKNS